MFVPNHICIVRGCELTRLRVVYLGAGEDIVITGCTADQQNCSVGQESRSMTKASIFQTLCRYKRFVGRIIEFRNGLWSVASRVSTGDQNLTVLQQGRCQPLPGSHQAPCILECSGLRSI